MPTPAALARIDAYVNEGGTILFDTRDASHRDAGRRRTTRPAARSPLRDILNSLDIPELEPVQGQPRADRDVLPAEGTSPAVSRTASSQVEAIAPPNDDEPERPRAAATASWSVLITSNDFAGAWAQRPDGQAMLPIVKQNEPRQRRFSFRAGVNIVMYTLTGNYKADQVHINCWSGWDMHLIGL